VLIKEENVTVRKAKNLPNYKRRKNAMKKFIAILLAVLMSVALLAACAPKETPVPAETEAPAVTEAPAPAATEAPAATPEATPAPLKMAMVTDVGGINDDSFNALAWKGHNDAKAQLGFEVSYVESKQESDYAPNFETVMDAGNNLIWGIGFLMTDTIREIAKANPDQLFACIDVNFGDDTPANLVGVTFKEQEPSFLVGYIAGKMTKTGKVGFVGGMDFDVIRRFHHGFEAGLKMAKPDVKFTAVYANSFGDAALGKSIASKMYQDGCDIVFHAAGFTGNGVIEAAKEKNQMVIGVDQDQNRLAPDNVITSACKGVDIAILAEAKALQDGTFKGGQNIVLGLKEGAVGIAPSSDKHVPAEILAEVKELEKKIIAGEIVVPGTEAEVAPFLAALPK